MNRITLVSMHTKRVQGRYYSNSGRAFTVAIERWHDVLKIGKITNNVPVFPHYHF